MCTGIGVIEETKDLVSDTIVHKQGVGDKERAKFNTKENVVLFWDNRIDARAMQFLEKRR